MSNTNDHAALICGILFGVLVGIGIGMLLMEKRLHNEAATKGHAEYYLDESHKAQWRWKDDGCVPSNRVEGAKEDEHGN